MIRRLILIAALIACAAGPSAVLAQQAQGKLTAEQYKKALWMATRFYGAQRSGHGPNWLLMDHTYKVSFVRDSVDNRDLVGGWFDCGDFVLFGQTFFYSAYMLVKAYEVFPTGFHDLYDGTNYSDYAASKDWSMAGGKPNGIPDLLEEVKYATDWIIKATPDASTFYYQKGNGGTGDGGDHATWVTSGYRSVTYTKSQGGEKDASRSICKNPNDATMASLAAGALAVMSKVYRKYDAGYAAKCSTHAVNAYAYAASKKGQAAGSCFGGYYGAATGKVPTYLHIGAAEMYRLTGDSSKYYADMRTDAITRNWAFDYQNPHDIAAYLSATTVIGDRQPHVENLRTQFVQRYSTTVNGEGVSTDGGEWGALRYLGNHAFTAALYSDLAVTASYDQFIYNQLDYILGKNARNYSFLVGFDDHGGQMAQKPHHRNVYLNDDNVPNAQQNSVLSIPERNKYFGFLVGGHRNPNSYIDDVTSYTSTEGGLDYQAGFVGALAYIISKLDPADTSKFTGKAPVQTPTTLRVSASANPGDAAAFISDTLRVGEEQSAALHVHVFDQNGVRMDMSGAECDLVTWSSWIPSWAPETGCSYNAPPPNSAGPETPKTITVTYAIAGPERFLSKTFIVAAGDVSVLPRNMSLLKNGYAVTVKPGSVVFGAAGNTTISKLGIYNMQGKTIFTRSGEYSEINWKNTTQPRGMYLVKMTMNNGAVVQRSLLLR